MKNLNNILYDIPYDKEGIFIERPNRFIARIEIDDIGKELVHVADSGRIKELLIPGARVKVQKAKNPDRKTKWTLISTTAEDSEDILLNSSFHRYISGNLLINPKLSPFGKLDSIKAEVKYKDSRIDYVLSKNNQDIWVEIKGVSFSENKIAMFPDAPSIRASKHLNHLIDLKKQGFRTAVILLVFRDSRIFRPRYETDIDFHNNFYKAINAGVEIFPVQLSYHNGKIIYKNTLPISENILLNKK